MAAPQKLNRGCYDALSQHLVAVGRIPLLTHPEEITLGRAVQNLRRLEDISEELTLRSGGKLPSLEAWSAEAGLSPQQLQQQQRQGRRARQRMVTANLRLVVTIASKYLHGQLELEDLIQEGNLGLMKAVDRFDPRLGYKFSTYAYWWIREGITSAITDKSRSIRLPLHVARNLGKLRRSQQELLQRLGRIPTVEELAEATGLKPLEIRETLFRSQHTISLDGSGSGDDDGSLLDQLSCSAEAPSERITGHLFRQDLETLLGELPSTEAELLRLRYGINESEPMSLSAAAQKMGVSRDLARGIERRAVAALKDRSERVVDYLET
ncbi:MAG: sigma-70 family RNA polymerase sigma factor [Synechococcaceae bacterium WB6_3B_236]|nr:sigma-70 family RNA polymerase sigma factor [Synechococcaceae bacterium WB6_3B_236]